MEGNEEQPVIISGKPHVLVPKEEVQKGDVVRWVDPFGAHINQVIRVHSGKEPVISVARHPHEGAKPIRVPLSKVCKCWRKCSRRRANAASSSA